LQVHVTVTEMIGGARQKYCIVACCSRYSFPSSDNLNYLARRRLEPVAVAQHGPTRKLNADFASRLKTRALSRLQSPLERQDETVNGVGPPTLSFAEVPIEDHERIHQNKK
jgi:hypothetical protein